MADDGRIVNDPLGNTIHLLQEIIMACEHQDESDNEIYDDAETVIRKPAMLFEVKDEGRPYLFYFRSVGWERTNVSSKYITETTGWKSRNVSGIPPTI